MDKIEIFQKCTVQGMVVKLPDIQLERKEYTEVKKALELIGGTWKGGKTFGFMFKEDPTDLLAELANGGNRNLKKEFQFFATPDKLADELVQLAGQVYMLLGNSHCEGWSDKTGCLGHENKEGGL